MNSTDISTGHRASRNRRLVHMLLVVLNWASATTAIFLMRELVQHGALHAFRRRD
jgi:hypothetical protein